MFHVDSVMCGLSFLLAFLASNLGNLAHLVFSQALSSLPTTIKSYVHKTKVRVNCDASLMLWKYSCASQAVAKLRRQLYAEIYALFRQKYNTQTKIKSHTFLCMCYLCSWFDHIFSIFHASSPWPPFQQSSGHLECTLNWTSSLETTRVHP